MALTELQLPTKADFYRRLQNSATELNNLMNVLGDLSEQIGRIGTVDLDAMGVATGAVRSDLIDYRTVLNEMISLYNGNAVTPTVVHANVIDQIRYI